MTRNPEIVTVIADGMAYTEWESVSVSYSINEACRSFSLQGTERPGQFRFPPGTAIQIYANADLVLDGYVNTYSPSGDAGSHTVSIAGRSKSQDFVDNSAVHKTGYFENKGPDEIAQELDEFGVGVTAEVPVTKIPYWQLAQGESPWRSCERALRPQGCVMMGKADGSIAITNASAAKEHSSGLIEGVNILSYSGELSDENRHDEYIVKGQGRTGHGDGALRPVGKAKDPNVKRRRPLVLINEGDTDTDRATKRAYNERDRAAGFSIKASIVTQGWRDDGGTIWQPNYLVFVSSPLGLHLVRTMLIESVTLGQDQGGQGSVTGLELVDPRAYGGEAGSDSGSDPSWDFDVPSRSEEGPWDKQGPAGQT